MLQLYIHYLFGLYESTFGHLSKFNSMHLTCIMFLTFSTSKLFETWKVSSFLLEIMILNYIWKVALKYTVEKIYIALDMIYFDF